MAGIRLQYMVSLVVDVNEYLDFVGRLKKGGTYLVKV